MRESERFIDGEIWIIWAYLSMGLAEIEVVLWTMFPLTNADSSVEALESTYPKTLPKTTPPAMPARTSFGNDPIPIYDWSEIYKLLYSVRNHSVFVPILTPRFSYYLYLYLGTNNPQRLSFSGSGSREYRNHYGKTMGLSPFLNPNCSSLKWI